MINIDELKARILSELEEAQAEDVEVLLQTVFSPTGNSRELAAFIEAVRALVLEGLVVMAPDLGDDQRPAPLTKKASLAAATDLSEIIEYDAIRRRWFDKRDKEPPFKFTCPNVVLTKQGLDRALQILEARGYQWWRPEN
jgi:hypothetical protein